MITRMYKFYSKVTLFYHIITQHILGYFYPDIVTVQSKNQETRDLHGSRLGDYLRERGRYSKGSPVWKQQGGDHVLSYNDWKEWVVSREGNKDMAGIKTETMGSDKIPSSGWMIWDSKQWKPDKELKVLGWLIFPLISFTFHVDCHFQ